MFVILLTPIFKKNTLQQSMTGQVIDCYVLLSNPEACGATEFKF